MTSVDAQDTPRHQCVSLGRATHVWGHRSTNALLERHSHCCLINLINHVTQNRVTIAGVGGIRKSCDYPLAGLPCVRLIAADVLRLSCLGCSSPPSH